MMADARLRIGIDARPLAEPPNGIRRWLEGILSGFSEAGLNHEFVLFVPRGGVSFPEGVKARIVVVPGSTRAVLRPAWETFRLPRALHSSGADVLLSPYGVVPPRCPVPTVSVVHDLAFMKWPDLLPRRYRFYWRWMTWTVPRAAAVVVPSKATGREVVARVGLPGDRISVVPYAADRSFAPASRSRVESIKRRYELPDSFVLAVGTLEPRKNIGMLIAAMDRVNAGRSKTVGLVLAGREGWGPQVEIRPWLHHVVEPDDRTLVALFSGASAFAMPSLDEGFGLPALEAMACAAPVVVAQAGALPEVVGDAGLAVPPDDVEGWARALGRVLNDQGMADDMSRRSLERAQNFSWTESATAVAGILDTVVRVRRSSEAPSEVP